MVVLGNRLPAAAKPGAPKPLNLPSLKKEYGVDSLGISLVPEGGPVWGGKHSSGTTTAAMRAMFEGMHVIASELHLHDVIERVIDITTRVLNCERVTLFGFGNDSDATMQGHCNHYYECRTNQTNYFAGRMGYHDWHAQWRVLSDWVATGVVSYFERRPGTS